MSDCSSSFSCVVRISQIETEPIYGWTFVLSCLVYNGNWKKVNQLDVNHVEADRFPLESKRQG